MPGTKRKSGPEKDTNFKGEKKPKIYAAAKSKGIQKPTVVVPEESSESEYSGNHTSGGIPLHSELANILDGGPQGPSGRVESKHQGREETEPKVTDTLHPDRARAVFTNSQSSKEAHAKQKQLARERKAAKPLADSLARTKKIWERLRRKSHVPVGERKQLVAELFEITTGKINDFILKHDSVRIVQTAVKYANLEQKRMIAREISGTYRQLAESRYAKFLIGKLLATGDNEIRDLIVPEFFGHVRRLIKHPESSWILDDVYRGVATKEQKAIILREWYGAEFALFQEGSENVSGNLHDILVANSTKRMPIMRSLLELIVQLIQKKMTAFTLLHDAMLQYFLNAKPGTEEIADFIELLKGDEEGDLMKNLAFTRSGSRVVCLALAHGNAKDRKHILKMYKDTLQMMAADPNGHIIILAAYEVIDDTVLTSKFVFPELLGKDEGKQVENIFSFANDINARIVLLYLFRGRSKSLFPASHSADLDILTEIDSLRAKTSKKDPETRRNELTKALSPPLLKAIAAGATNLVASSFGCQFITEVLFGAEGDKSAALAAVAAAAAGNPSLVRSPAHTDTVAAEGALAVPHVAATAYGGKMLKALIAGGRFDNKINEIVPIVPALGFSDILYSRIKDYVMEWATGSSSFVILALIESSNFKDRDKVLEILRTNKKMLQTTIEKPNKGLILLLKMLE